MRRKILITQCLQNDFVRPIGPYDALPNLLHIGYGESLRLMGDIPAEGPVAQMMNWAHAHVSENFKIIHIRDWHDKQDQRQETHLKYFGSHCVQNTEGAEFAFQITDKQSVQIVNALTLNDFLDSNLAEVLEPYKDQPIDVGLIGVWTEAKIAFLAYELTTRYPQMNLAVCSALTASSSRAQHFIALNQLEKVLGVKVYNSIGDFVQFLGDDSSQLQLTQKKLADSLHLKIESEVKIDQEAQDLIQYLFRDCQSLKLKALDGGFSGNYVLATKSIDQYGHSQVPHVLKIGPKKLIASERTAFERIEAVLGNNAPRIVEFADLQSLGGIKYRYASMGGQALSFQKIYMGSEKLARLKNILSDVFVEQLGRLYSAAELESCNLLQYYSFRPELSERVYKMAKDAGATELEAQSLKDFYCVHLPELLKEPEYRYFSYIHGDLNGANIMIDGHENVWLIDFFHTHRGHILKDLVKLENDLLFIYTSIKSESELKSAIQFSKELLEVEDLWQIPHFRANELKLPQLKRAAHLIRHLRSFYKILIQADRDTYQLSVAQMRYAIHTLIFEESNAYQKRWALWTALSLANKIIERAQSSKKLRIDWIEIPKSKNSIGLTILPGRKDRNRNLKDDIDVLKVAGISSVVCLVTHAELKRYGVANLIEIYRTSGIEVHDFQIIDGKAPVLKDLKKLILILKNDLESRNKILIHCVGGLGRSGLVAACLLKTYGLNSKDAIELVRKQRSRRAIETEVQEKFVSSF